jgi:hypothetical protein
MWIDALGALAVATVRYRHTMKHRAARKARAPSPSHLHTLASIDAFFSSLSLEYKAYRAPLYLPFELTFASIAAGVHCLVLCPQEVPC